MTALRADWITQSEEPKLARHLIDRVVGRASGTFDAECTHSAPRDKYFIGTLRPSRLDDDSAPDHHGGFPDELLRKLAPMAFGAELLLRPDGRELAVNVTLEWSCYYRVFPTLEEQRQHQHTLAAAGQGQPGAATAPASAGSPRGGRGRARSAGRSQTDYLFPKYRKVGCHADGRVLLRRTGNEWVVDPSELQAAADAELVRVCELILADPDHLRTTVDPNVLIRIAPEDLESEVTYARFKHSFTTPVLPAWSWMIAARVTPNDRPGFLDFFLEATNSSPIDTRSWHTDGYLFETRLTLDVTGATVAPFELELAPRSFRFDKFLWGRGFNCSLERHPLPTGGHSYQTESAPVYAQPRYTTNTEPAAPFDALSTEPLPVLRKISEAMHAYEGQWTAQRAHYVKSDPTWTERHGAEYAADEATYRSEVARFDAGVALIEGDEDVRQAFRLTNEAFRRGGDKTAWRLFQIVFLVSQLPGIHRLARPSAGSDAERETVDIIYFPTGGGKTEAYLGVVVFHCFFDRLRGKSAGVTTWTRFPLRLLTLQQMQRVADVVGAAELIRRSERDDRLIGADVDPFGVGYFVGAEATPNELTPPRQGDAPDSNWSTAIDSQARQRWKKIVRCPACRTTTVVVDFDTTAVRLLHRCTNATCAFPGGVLPVFVVDNEIYRYLPSVVVGTIDKLASIGNQRKVSLILGYVKGRCRDHGYYNGKCCQKNCTDRRRLQQRVPRGISGPTLLVQDELHLLKEGLGTFDGHYETFLQALLRRFGQTAPVKVIASSATIEAFDRQVRHLYGRSARIFPGFGPTLGTSFYAQTLEYPQRLFVGILPHNKTIFRAVLELIQYYREELERLVRAPAAAGNPFGGQVQPGTAAWRELLDPYVTTLAYFSSTRELSQIRTDVDTYVNTVLEKRGIEPLRIAELAGSTSTDNVTTTLTALEQAAAGSRTAPDMILATSMISHGVDVERLNCLVFYGMPKQTAEYIQSSSRVGRVHVGVVIDCLKPTRERDQSHFAYFEKYHEFLGRLVEPVAINRWSKFSVNRTVPGLFMAVLLQLFATRSDDPGKFYDVRFVKKLISDGTLRAEDFIPILEEAYLLASWQGPGADAFRQEMERRVRLFLDQILGAAGQDGFVSNALSPAPMNSLRDVDEQLPIDLDSNGSTWAVRGARRVAP